jgi:TolB-like protein
MHPFKKYLIVFVSILSLLGLVSGIVGCVKEDIAAVHEKGGKRYGVTRGLFQGRWYHYYERGLSFAEGKFWQEAERDYRSAIRQRDGDQLRARTYGVHFIEYFPHRELGVALFHQKRYQEAIEELNISLNAEVSAKAEFYLDRARKAKILALAADKKNPQIMVSSPAQDHYTNAQRVRISGRVRDDTFVKAIQVNGEDVRIDLSSPEVRLDLDVALQIGKNTVTVAATDIVGNTSQLQVTVHVDRMGPVISLDPSALRDTATSGKILVRGIVYDDTNLAKLVVNDHRISMPRAKEFELEQYVVLAAAQEEIVVEASDELGNQTMAKISVDKKSSMVPSVLLAAASIPYLAENQSKPGKSKEVTLPRDNIKPLIEINDWETNQSVYLDEAYLAGHAQDNEWVDSLMLNEQHILRRPGKSVFFNSLVTLNIGPNLFQFEAWDHSGNQTALKINIERKIQEVRDIGARMDLVIVPFLRKGSSYRYGAVVEEMLLSALERSNRFRITSALGLDPQELEDPEAAARIGRRMKANYVLTGTLIESQDSLDIYANVIETSSSLIMSREDVYGEQIDRRVIRNLCRGLAIKLKDDFPVVEGKVSEVQGKRIRLDFSGEHRLIKGMRCILFREELRLDEQSKKILDRREIRLGSALITTVKKTSESKMVCEAEIYATTENFQIKRGHLVITQ